MLDRETSQIESERSTGITIIGAKGFIGSFVSKDLELDIFSPPHSELDIADIQSLKSVLEKKNSSIIINFAAHTNLAEAEKERGNKDGKVWKINVEGVKNLSKICRETGMFLVHISTDAVFPGTEAFPGPYTEDVKPPDDPTPLGWYAYTKLKSEEVLQDTAGNWAIVRISYPFGNIHNLGDFAVKNIQYVKEGYSFFKDQKFTPTFLPDLSKALNRIVSKQVEGIHHVVCSGTTTPYDFARYLAGKLGLATPIKSSSLDNYAGVPRAKKGGLKNEKTEERLGLKFYKWQEALDQLIPKLQPT